MDVKLEKWHRCKVDIEVLKELSKKYDFSKPVYAMIAIDTKPYASDSNPEVLNYAVATLEVGQKVTGSTKLSELSKNFKKEFNEKITPISFAFDKFNRSMALKKFAEPESFLKVIKENQKSTVLISNVGESGLKNKYGALELKQCYHVPTVHVIDKPFICLAVATHHHELTLSFSYPAHLISRLDVEELADGLCANLSYL